MIERAQHPRRVRSPSTKNPDTAYTHDSESMCGKRGARVWRRVVGAFASEKPRFRSAHLWTLVKYIVVPRGRESPAAVRHVEARPAGAALLGEVRISSRQRAPALVARPLRSLLAGQVVTPRPGRGDTRAYRVVRHLLGDRKMLHEPRGDALLAKCPRRAGQILFSHKPRLHPLQTTTFPDSIVHTPVYKQEGPDDFGLGFLSDAS